jgi:hypothetical protein
LYDACGRLGICSRQKPRFLLAVDEVPLRANFFAPMKNRSQQKPRFLLAVDEVPLRANFFAPMNQPRFSNCPADAL